MKNSIAFILLGLFAIHNVNADPSGLYVGISGLEDDAEFRGDKDEDTGWEIRLGYSINKYFAVQAGYLDLGEVVLPNFADGGGSVETDGVAVSALAMFPMGDDFSVVGKVGLLAWERDGVLGSIAGPRELSEDGSDLMLGIGFSYHVTDKVDITADYNDSEDFTWIAGGINYHF